MLYADERERLPLWARKAVTLLVVGELVLVIRVLEERARSKFDSEVNDMKRDLQTLIQEASNTLPDLPHLDQYLKEVPNELLNAASTLAKVRSRIETDVRQHLDKAQLLVKLEIGHIDTLTEVETYALGYTGCIDYLKGLPEHAEEYRQALRSLETIVGQAASSDEDYRKRQSWLSCAKAQADILNDFKWERAKSAAQKDLENIRKELMKFRGEYLEGRRASFSKEYRTYGPACEKTLIPCLAICMSRSQKGKAFQLCSKLRPHLTMGSKQERLMHSRCLVNPKSMP